ncbi:ABC transporter ATP-binding protein [Clostridium manihotivorum]|uniref:ABC transporter ATP-binding protein n=1 Tax=Clostridium manihotivorum TaxID=2320868 RepID=A0A3R5U8Y9_9CLOT|nr:ABC transporter ATP-binding protein [Clostridium manihotivorum]QAA32299.1 ABC transporter ATP-binding protein [Clostridium manihotivorum]
MKDSILQLKNVTKKVDGKIILDDINLELYIGQALAVLGRNGMGKSTLLKSIAGLVALTGGERIISKKDMRISYVPEHFPKLNFTVNEYLYHMGSILGLKNEEIKAKLDILYERLNISHMANQKITVLSKGSMQKVALIQALLIKCDLLIMDEPLSGQDIKSQKTLIELISELKKQDTTIVFACHEMHLVETISDRVIVVDKGKIVDHKVKEYNKKSLKLLQLKNINQVDMDFLRNLQGVINFESYKDITDVLVEKECCDNVVFTALKNGISIMSLNEITN